MTVPQAIARRLSRWGRLLVGTGLAALLGSCAWRADPPGDRLVIGTRGVVNTVDPAQAYRLGALQLLQGLGEPLYAIAADGSLEPRLAAGPPQRSADGLRLRIPLREGVLFHDGSRFDAEAMAFSLRRFRDAGGALSYLIREPVAAIHVVGPLELELELKAPYAPLERLLSFIGLTPVSPASTPPCAPERPDGSSCFQPDRFIGTGPFRLGFHSRQQQRLERFDDYWDTPAASAGIDVVRLNNSTALFGALGSGEIDLLFSNGIAAEHQRALTEQSREGRLREVVGPANGIEFFALATDRPPLDDLRLRQALALSLDRQLIARRVSYDLRRPLRSLLPEASPGAIASWPAADPAAARRLFREAGYCDGQILRLPLTFRSNTSTDKLVALTWQAQVESDLGDCLALEPVGYESSTIYEQLATGAFSLVLIDWSPDFPDPENYLRPMLSCSSFEGSRCTAGEAVEGGSFWYDATVAADLEAQQNSRGEARLQLLRRIQQRTATAVPYLPLWQLGNRAWASPGVEGLWFDGNGWLDLARLKRDVTP